MLSRHRNRRASACSISEASCSNGARYASGRILITTSAASSEGRILVLDSSRSRRLTRFLATADCRNRGMIKPTRVHALCACARGEAMARTSRKVVRIRFPSCTIRCSSAPRVMRTRRGNLSDAWGVSGSCVLVRNTDSQLLTPLFPAASKRLTTPLRFHTRTETVRLEPPSVARAVGGLSHDYSKYGLSKLRHRQVKLASAKR
jgi:hypothetical protein